MGKATIYQAHGEGRYTIDIVFNRDYVDTQVTNLTADIARIDAALPAATALVTEKYLAASTAREVLGAKISAMNANDNAETQAAVKTATAELYKARASHEAAKSAEASLRLRKLSAQKRIGYLNSNVPTSQSVEAWCLDFTDNLAAGSEVGTVEVARVDGVLHFIQPGFEGNAAYDGDRDGILQHVLSMHPAAVFYNYAMLPGAARWKPLYRVATITAMGDGVCTVTLDAVTSTHQNLNVNPESLVLTDVAFEYMDCHGLAFDEGDRVVLAFDGSWSTPKVIGFESNPKPCSLKGVVLNQPGLRYVRIDAEGEYQTRTPATAQVGNCNWFGPDGLCLSWDGPAHRYFLQDVVGDLPFATSSNIYRGGRIWGTLPSSRKVLAAAISPDGRKAFALGGPLLSVAGPFYYCSDAYPYMADIGSDGLPGAWRQIGEPLDYEHTLGANGFLPWPVSENGQKMVVPLTHRVADVCGIEYAIDYDAETVTQSVTYSQHRPSKTGTVSQDWWDVSGDMMTVEYHQTFDADLTFQFSAWDYKGNTLTVFKLAGSVLVDANWGWTFEEVEEDVHAHRVYYGNYAATYGSLIATQDGSEMFRISSAAHINEANGSKIELEKVGYNWVETSRGLNPDSMPSVSIDSDFPLLLDMDLRTGYFNYMVIEQELSEADADDADLSYAWQQFLKVAGGTYQTDRQYSQFLYSSSGPVIFPVFAETTDWLGDIFDPFDPARSLVGDSYTWVYDGEYITDFKSFLPAQFSHGAFTVDTYFPFTLQVDVNHVSSSLEHAVFPEDKTRLALSVAQGKYFADISHPLYQGWWANNDKPMWAMLTDGNLTTQVGQPDPSQITNLRSV